MRPTKIRIALLLLVPAFALASATCSNDEAAPAPAPVAPADAPPAPVTPAVPLEPMPEAGADPCARLVAEFARLLAAAPGKCVSAADCACYQGGIGEASGCGGVTDAMTAGALSAIAGSYRGAGCRHTVQCAPWACDPKCVDGKCAR